VRIVNNNNNKNKTTMMPFPSSYNQRYNIQLIEAKYKVDCNKFAANTEKLEKHILAYLAHEKKNMCNLITSIQQS
jgi:hypothetical protein